MLSELEAYRDTEFKIRAGSTDEQYVILERSTQAVSEVLSSLEPDDLDGVRLIEGYEVSVRWGLLHVVDHSDLHLGHMQITRQLWDGGKAKPSPFWHERLPRKKAAEQGLRS
ncbi:MAG TPA: DUF664 domain-containing protein [Anaerolineaceae bacterium]|nr:DUF664 domain-containing protein [Anaerolineaceae bacterium]